MNQDVSTNSGSGIEKMPTVLAEQTDGMAVSRFFEGRDVSTTLPTFPKVGMAIVDALQQDDPDVNFVVSLIECEPNISQKVLQLANSPLYAAPRPITTIAHATVMLGFRKVANLATATAAESLFQSGEASKFSIEIFEQSLAIATVACVLAEKIGMPNPDEAFMCGVFHDVGKLVLGRTFPDFYETKGCVPNNDPTQIEFDALGICHAQLGQHCSKVWGLPAVISQAIREHHHSIVGQLQPLHQVMIMAVYFAPIWLQRDSEPDTNLDETIESMFSEKEKQQLSELACEKIAVVNEICLS